MSAADHGAVAWTDTHCHIQESFYGDGLEREDLFARAERAAVTRMICVGTGLETSRAAVELARQRPAPREGAALFASVGLHPHEAVKGTGPVASYLEEVMVDQGAARAPGCVVALGECGLDYFYEHSPRAAQRRAFAEQIALAATYDLTLVVHSRGAFDETVELLGDAPSRQRVVIHCFSGGTHEAERLVGIGCFLSFSGIVTFKNAQQLRDAARMCPAERLLVETDAPFLTPVPYRGRRNEPAHVSVVGAFLAELRDESVVELAERTSENAVRAFSLEL